VRVSPSFVPASICVTPLFSVEPATAFVRPLSRNPGEEIMSFRSRPARAGVLTRLARYAKRVVVLTLRVLIVSLSMGVAPPSLVEKFVRQEDPTAQVAEEEAP
jgi:hypothetical protein